MSQGIEISIKSFVFKDLCHFRMTPLRIIPQYVSNAPYTTPAKKGSEIGSRVYCMNVISDRGLFRLDLNIALHTVEKPIYK